MELSNRLGEMDDELTLNADQQACLASILSNFEVAGERLREFCYDLFHDPR